MRSSGATINSMRIIKPPQQDEGLAMVKSLFVCETKGCSIVHERKAKFCPDCSDKSVRDEIERQRLNKELSVEYEKTIK